MTGLAGRAAWLKRCWGTGLGAIAALAIPRQCPICGDDGERDEGPFCEACREELLDAAGLVCPRCALPVGPYGVMPGGCGECRWHTLGFDAAVALGPYSGSIRDLCLRMKHRPDGWIARWLAALVVESSEALRNEATRVKKAEALIVPVPLHWRRKLKRGYNQADALADGFARQLGLTRARALKRVKTSVILAGLGRTERAKVLRKAFQVRPRVELSGRTVFLVDDVLTTGATCNEAARALKKAGAKRVVAVVIGRADGGLRR